MNNTQKKCSKFKKIFKLCYFLILTLVDLRSGYCFSRIENDQCLYNNLMNISRASCCCSLAGGWGYPGCEPCPAKGTEEFNYICSSPGFVRGKGMRLHQN